MTAASTPPAVTIIFCEWNLLSSIFPAGAERRETKTYVHKSPKTQNFAITRLVDGKYAGHLILTPTEMHSLADIA